jgi:hypothetical protein
LLQPFADSWPSHAPETLVARLEVGPEREEALAALLDAIFHPAPEDVFDTDVPRIVDALDVRCASATEGTTLSESCQRAKEHFDPDTFHFGSLYGTASSHCGGVFVRERGICGELDAAFSALAEEAGVFEVHFLDGDVRIAD